MQTISPIKWTVIENMGNFKNKKIIIQVSAIISIETNGLSYKVRKSERATRHLEYKLVTITSQQQGHNMLC